MIKKLITNFIYKLIELIEKIEYRKLDLNENDISKKIIKSYELEDIYVKSDNGYVPASEFHITQPYKVWEICLENGMSLRCADNHIVFTDKLEEIFTKNLTINHYLFTDKGVSKVKSVKKLNHKVSMCDLTVNDQNHRYYTSGILSHNTVSAAIFILHFVTFNNDKNVLIAANKLETVKEIINKIKSIYYLLPFWLKPSIVNWTQTTITIGNTNCVIKTTAATSNAGIGNSIDVLYLDEMAHLPAEILEDFYRSIFPTVSGIENSKIIVTSTPNGYNLFWRLLSGAEKPVGDKEKNKYKALRVYWWQVPGRYVSYLRLDHFICKKYNITSDEIFIFIKNQGFECEKIYSIENDKWEIHIQNKNEYIPSFLKDSVIENNESIITNYLRSIIYEKNDIKLKLSDFCDISSWKEDAIKDIGGEESFNQEYDLQFANGNKVLFDSQTLDKLSNDKVPFIYQQIDKLDKKTFIDYQDLVWIKDRPDLFELSQAKKYYIIIGVDLSEGLGQDSSVINIFRIFDKKEDSWPKNVESLYDLFKVEQIGLFRSNIMSVKEIAELLYLICFDIFDSNNIGVVLEVNAFGGELLNNMRELWNGRNEFSNHIFFRYKHREDAVKKDIGIKLRQNKNLFVKDYQKRIKLGDIVVHEEETLKEMTTFVKKETRNGNFSYEADSGHDDCVMTVVELSTIFNNSLFHELVSRLMNELPENIKKSMEIKLGDNPNINGADYSVLFKAQQKLGNNPWSPKPNTSFGQSGYGSNTDWSKNWDNPWNPKK